MSLKVVFRRAAAEEFADARQWYDGKRPGLGEEFAGCVDAAITSASRSPLQHAKVHGEVRRVLVRRFPYGVFYVVDDSTLVVPSVWRDR